MFINNNNNVLGPVTNTTTAFQEIGKTHPNVPRAVCDEIFNYWISKRSKIRKSLLRRFWPVTSSDDTNPNLTFRPREKERYRLRKKRANDAESRDKLNRLKSDFVRVHDMLEIVRRRERMKKLQAQLVRDEYLEKVRLLLKNSAGGGAYASLSVPVLGLVELVPELPYANDIILQRAASTANADGSFVARGGEKIVVKRVMDYDPNQPHPTKKHKRDHHHVRSLDADGGNLDEDNNKETSGGNGGFLEGAFVFFFFLIAFFKRIHYIIKKNRIARTWVSLLSSGASGAS